MCKAREMLLIRFFYSLLQTRNFGSIYCIALIDIERRHGLSKVHDLTLKTKENILQICSHKKKKEFDYSQQFGKMLSLYYRYCVSTIVVQLFVSSNHRAEDVYFCDHPYLIGFCCYLSHNWRVLPTKQELVKLSQQIIHFQLLREMIAIAQKAFSSNSRATCKVHLKRAKSDHQLPIKK